MTEANFDKKYCLEINTEFHEKLLLKGMWLILVNAARIPPHVGVAFNGKYSSLNITGRELDINILALLKRLNIQKIKTVFIALAPHPVFSIDYLKEYFTIQINQFEKVEIAGATCFSPVRTFFIENYFLQEKDLEYLYCLFPLLKEQEVIQKVMVLNMDVEATPDRKKIHLPVYTKNDIDNKLKNLASLNQPKTQPSSTC